MPFSATLYEEMEKLDSSTRSILIKVLKEIEFNIGELVTRRDFNDLKEEVKKLTQSVQELTEAQKKTDKTVQELAEAQKKTEQRLEALTHRVDELAEAQKKTELRLEALTHRVDELAEAQKKTELRLNELAQAQKKTEQAILELTKGLKETREELKETREHLGGLSDTVGYTLENQAYKALPNLLKRDYGIEIEGRLKRGYLKDRKGRDVEVNILGKGKMNGKEVTIIGESKVRLSKKAVKDFIEIRLKNFESLYGEIFPVLVTHMISEPDVEDFAKEKGIALYYSYDF